MKIISIINTESGSVPEEGDRQLSDALGDIGLTSKMYMTSGPDLRKTIDKAVAEKPDVLISWGGDGTVACCLNAARGIDIPVLALPGGTMNLVHTRIHGECDDWRELIQTLVRPLSPRPLAGGLINRQTFYVAAMVGTLTELAISREHLRSGELFGAAKSALKSNSFNLDARLQWQLEGMSEQKHAAALAIVPPQTSDAPLTIARINPSSLIDLTRTALSTMVRGWEDADGVDIFASRGVHIADRSGANISATLDGEPIETPPQIEIEVQSIPALVLSPR